jgi:hypothetical protein
MSISNRARIAFAGILATAALGAAAPAQADQADRCERKYERLEQRFREIEQRRGWEAAAEWWNERGWPTYYERCLAP